MRILLVTLAVTFSSGSLEAQEAPISPKRSIGRRDTFLRRLRENGIHHHRQQTLSRCCLPLHDYEHNIKRPSKSVLAFGGERVDVTWLEKRRKKLENGVETTNPQRRKNVFHARPNSVQVDHIELSRIGLTLYSTGELLATGDFIHHDSPMAPNGSRVFVELRAFAGPAKDQGPLIDAAMVWKVKQEFWISRNSPQSLRIFSDSRGVAPLRRHFNEINHIEVNLSYQRDR